MEILVKIFLTEIPFIIAGFVHIKASEQITNKWFDYPFGFLIGSWIVLILAMIWKF